MDSLRVTKVDQVSCRKSGNTLQGTLHLTAHHLIFRYDEGKADEMWVPYPLISLVTRLPQTLQGQSPLTFHTRTFETFTMSFGKESESLDVFESVKELTVAESVQKLYAFYYSANRPTATADGWSIYSPREEFGRMGVGARTKAWRFTDINKDYSFSPTYPARLVVPTKISDTTLQYAAKYRSKARIPVLSYLHWANFGSITRSSQPMVGLTQNRSIQDEKLIEAIFQSHHSPESRASSSPVYGATATNLIIDARPTTNAMANTAKGAGTENMDHYKESKKAYLGIDNIHVMRESLGKVVEALHDADNTLASINNDLAEDIAGLAVLDRQALRRSGWLRHISAIIEGSVLIVRNVHVNSSHTLIHCSDGWDRTAQLSSIAQLCLDPYYRTYRGFEILIEKDWLSFGHKFLDRCGHLSSDKFFVSPAETTNNSGDAAQAFLASVQNRFASQNHIKETSPVFHQFLEAVRQIQRQYPTRFEFNERFLQQIYYHLYSCQFGTFLFNTERDRRVGEGTAPACEMTASAWDYFNTPEEKQPNTNPGYDPTLDDPTGRSPNPDMGVLLPNSKDVRFWHELYGRSDEEMNGRIPTTQAPVEIIGPVESVQDDPILRTETPTGIPLPPSPSKPPPISLDSSQFNSMKSSANLPPPRSLSPLPGASTREAPKISREDSFKPYDSTSSSAFSLKPTGMGSGDSSYSPNRPRAAKQGDFFASSGVKSVWGKLSSNASAALSVVQEAYGGVAGTKTNSTAEVEVEKSGELRNRDSLLTWGDESSQSSSSVRPSTIGSSNPWSTSSAGEVAPVSAPFDNPWGSVRNAASPRRSGPGVIDEELFSRPLPEDPSVARPHIVSRGPSADNINKLPPTRSKLSTTSSTSNSDPLGVGFL